MSQITTPTTTSGLAAALIDSMRSVQRTLTGHPQLSPQQLLARLAEWQHQVGELAGEAANGQQLAILYDLSQVVNSSLNLDETLNKVMGALISLTGAERGCLMLAEENGHLDMRAARNLDQQSASPSDLELSLTVVQRVIRDGQIVLTTNAQIDPRFSAQESIVAYHLRSIVCVPLTVRGRVIGAIYLDNRLREGVFSEEILPLLNAFANQAAVAIENARLYTMTDHALAERLQELTVLYEQVRQANQAKTEFISLVAHELRTPMTSIRGYADILHRGILGPLTPQQAEFIATIRDNVQRMQLLVSDLQDVSRIETGNLRLQVHPTALGEALDSALRSTQPLIQERSQELHVDVPEELPTVQADPTRLAQILINLLSNAAKYTPEGGQIDVRAWSTDTHVHCAVADTGIGISPQDQERLFTKFFRSEDPAVREMTGTGLGLCIVKNLVEMQGGTLTVQSHLGHGTTVTFTIPLGPESPQEESTATAQPSAPPDHCQGT